MYGVTCRLGEGHLGLEELSSWRVYKPRVRNLVVEGIMEVVDDPVIKAPKCSNREYFLAP